MSSWHFTILMLKVVCVAGAIQASNKSMETDIVVLLAATVPRVCTNAVLPRSQHPDDLAVNLYSYVFWPLDDLTEMVVWFDLQLNWWTSQKTGCYLKLECCLVWNWTGEHHQNLLNITRNWLSLVACTTSPRLPLFRPWFQWLLVRLRRYSSHPFSCLGSWTPPETKDSWRQPVLVVQLRFWSKSSSPVQFSSVEDSQFSWDSVQFTRICSVEILFSSPVQFSSPETEDSQFEKHRLAGFISTRISNEDSQFASSKSSSPETELLNWTA